MINRICFFCLAVVAAAAISARAEEMVQVPEPPALPSSVEEGPIDEPSSWWSLLRLRYGPWSLRPHIAYRYVQAYGIQSEPGVEDSTIIETVAPGFRLNLGTTWYFDYTASWTTYSNEAFEDNLGHNARLVGRVSKERWDASFSQTFTYSSVPLVETGEQTTQEIHSTDLTFSRELWSNWQWDTQLFQDLRYVEKYSDSLSRGADTSLRFQLTPTVYIGAGFGASYVTMEESSDSFALRYSALFGVRLSQTLTYRLRYGFENREFIGEGSRMRTPILSTELEYQPFETTTVTLSLNRSVATSYFRHQLTRTVNWRGTLNQRLLQRFYFTGHVNYRETAYKSTVRRPTFHREDEGLTLGARLGTRIFRQRVSLSAFYTHSQNVSNRDGIEFYSDQMGFEISASL